MTALLFLLAITVLLFAGAQLNAAYDQVEPWLPEPLWNRDLNAHYGFGTYIWSNPALAKARGQYLRSMGLFAISSALIAGALFTYDTPKGSVVAWICTAMSGTFAVRTVLLCIKYRKMQAASALRAASNRERVKHH